MSLFLRLVAALALPLGLLAPAVGAAAATAGSGTVASQTRSVSEFQAIRMTGPFRLVVRQAATASVQVRADDNLLPLIETTVEEGRHGRALRIGVQRGESIRPRSEVVITVDVVKLERIDSVGAGKVEVQALSTPALTLTLAGSGDAQLRGLSAEALTLQISGHGDISAAGRVTRLDLSIAGSGEARLQELSAEEASVRIMGSGEASLTAHRTLGVRIAGSGDVVYAGNATLSTSIAGSGKVSRR